MLISPLLKIEEVKGPYPYRFAYDPGASWFTHVNEHATRAHFWSRIRSGDVVVDVGAACGSYVLYALAQGAGHVYALEPVLCGEEPAKSDNVVLLLASLDANDWRGRCSILPFGLWDDVGWLTLQRTPGARPAFIRAPEAGSSFPVTTLDLVAKTYAFDRVDWVKIDVEGAEVEVLRGGLETLRRLRPRILVENHVFMDDTIPDRVAAVLEPLGYVAWGSMPCGGVTHVLWEPKP